MAMRMCLLATWVMFIPEAAVAGENPNFLWITCEDISPYLGCYGCRDAHTPTQVPLIVRFPKKWQHLAPSRPGSTADRLVSFVDFPKTVLSLARLPVPDSMQGRIFLGPDAEPAPQVVHFYRDRMAERYDFSRAVTDGRYYYVRNFMPHRPRGRDSRYGPTVQANWVAWEDHYDAGKCDPVQSQFFLPKPPVEFFDTESDPWHIKNLVGQAEHENSQRRLARDLDRWMIETRDIGLIPEPLA